MLSFRLAGPQGVWATLYVCFDVCVRGREL